MTDTEPMVFLPSVTFNEETSWRITPEVRTNIHRTLENLDHFVKAEDNLPSMHDLSYDETSEFLNLMFYQEEWIKKNCGVQIQGRIVGSRNIFLLESDKFKEIYKRSSPNTTDEHLEGVRGAHSFGRQIILRKSDDPQKDAMHGMHELFHAYGETMIRVKESPQGENTLRELSVSRFGYERFGRGKKFGYLSESVIELMKVRMVHDYAQKSGKKELLAKLEVGYPQQVILFDMLFDKATGILKQSGQVTSRAELDRIIFRGYFTGSQEGFQLLHKVFGPKAMKEIADYDDRDGPQSLKTICDATGLDFTKIEERTALLTDGGEVKLASGDSFHFSQDQIKIFKD